jgi:hypothetical protein
VTSLEQQVDTLAVDPQIADRVDYQKLWLQVRSGATATYVADYVAS